jgi:hypothetical protein
MQKQKITVGRENLEKKNKWIDFDIVLKGWNKASQEFDDIISQIKNKSMPLTKELIFKFNCFLAFTIAIKIPTGRTQNLKVIMKKDQSKLIVCFY